jgi:cytidylate kinase
MNFIVIFGPPAVGKMTVGQELAKLTGYKLFHNHVTIDLVTEYFDFGTPAFSRLVREFRMRIIQEAAASDLPGLIFTFVWGLDLDADKQFIDELKGIVDNEAGKTYFVELEADIEERLRRNKTENRLKHKKKGDLAASEARMLRWEGIYRMNSAGDFFYLEDHLKINNSALTAERVARQIMETFDLRKEGKVIS